MFNVYCSPEKKQEFYVILISKYAAKMVGTQDRQVACVHWTEDQKQPTFSKGALSWYGKLT